MPRDSLPRYKLTIAYDGTDFCGWQRQEPLAPARGIDPADPDDASSSPAADKPVDQRPARPSERSLSPSKVVERLENGRVALRTVQHVLDKAISEVINEPAVTLGSSRTDAGVHARGQVVAFTCNPREDGFVEETKEQRQARKREILARHAAGAGSSDAADAHATPQPPTSQAASTPADRPSSLPAPDPSASSGRSTGWPLERGLDTLIRAINGKLPPDVLVKTAHIVPYGWDPIAGAKSKGYSYTFHTSRLRPLFDRHFVHQVWDPLDAQAMHEAAQVLVGEHDFAAFTAVNHGRLTTIRTVHTCSVTRESAERVRIDISGGGFLYNMVRIIAGTLFEVGRGSWSIDRVRAALASKDRQQSGPTLPGRGLCLEWVKYD